MKSTGPWPDATERPRRTPAAAASESAVSLLIGGALCLYFGLTLAVTAPGSANEQETARWFALNTGIHWALRLVGGLFLLTALLCWRGLRSALLLTAITEGLFTALMLFMTVSWTLEAHADGEFNYQVILLLILALLSVGSILRAWRAYVQSGPVAEMPQIEDPHARD